MKYLKLFESVGDMPEDVKSSLRKSYSGVIYLFIDNNMDKSLDSMSQQELFDMKNINTMVSTLLDEYDNDLEGQEICPEFGEKAAAFLSKYPFADIVRRLK